jgi:hypothetical protein
MTGELLSAGWLSSLSLMMAARVPGVLEVMLPRW